jgi:hypothetical protein
MSIIDFEADRAILSTRSQALEATTMRLIACILDTERKTIANEATGIEQRRFTTTVGTDCSD